MRRLRNTGLIAALAALAACGRCGGAAGPPPERYVPADAVAVLVVPELRGAARSLAEFYSTASDFPGTSQLPELRASLSAQLGFDPLDLGSLRDAGIDPRRGLAVGLVPAPSRARSPIVVLPISNHAAADALVRRIAVDRLGARERTVEPVGAVQVAVYRTSAAALPALAVGEGDGYLILSTGPAAAATVAAAVELRAPASLAASGAWRLALRSAGEEPAAIALVPPGSPALEGLWAFRDGVALSISAEPGRLLARALLLLGDREAGLLALEADGAGGALTGRLDPAAAAVGRWDGDPAALGGKLAALLPAPERARLAKAGIDPARDLFGPLAPGAAAAVSLAPGIDLAKLDGRSLRSDPLRLVQFELLLPLRDPALASAVSERLVRLAGQRARGEPFAVPTASGEVAWVVDRDRVVAAGGAKGRLAALRARLGEAAGGYRAPTDASRKLLASGGLGAVVLDTQNFVASVRALPPEAFGTGPTGFVMRSLAERIVDPAARIEAVGLRAQLEPGALLLILEVEPRARETP